MLNKKPYHIGDHLHRLTGDDFNTTYQSNNSRGEFIFYSIIFIIGILALGVVWQ